jgi:methyltransferase (TIGR00027 family)
MSEQAGWDIVSGVGLTALGVAAVRAIEGHHPEPLVRDPYAAAFVRAAADQLPAPMATTPEEAAADPEFPWFAMAHHVAVRSKFFDDFFRTATAEAGIRQAVILAAGLDTRAFRLDWPSGAAVYEIDAPLVIAFKDSVLRDHGAAPRCDRRTVAIDLREDWPVALRDAGFDPASPAVWLAEGLFPYLTDEAIGALLSRVHELSAPGSRIAIEHLPVGVSTLSDTAAQAVRSRAGEETAAMWVTEQRHDSAVWLRDHGWAAAVDPVPAVAESYGRPMTDTPLGTLRTALFITGRSGSGG